MKTRRLASSAFNFHFPPLTGHPARPLQGQPLVLQGLTAPLLTRAACSRWKRPPRGGLGRAAMASCFSRRARWIGVSVGAASAGAREAGWPSR